MGTPEDVVSELTRRVEALERCGALESRIAALEKVGGQSSYRDELKKHWVKLLIGVVVLALVLIFALALFSDFAASVIGALGTSGANSLSWAAITLWLGTLISTTWALVAVLALLKSRDRD